MMILIANEGQHFDRNDTDNAMFYSEIESLLAALAGLKHSANATWCFRGVLHSQDAI